MSTNSPNIAVLLPSYNPGPEIVGTLDSLRAQSIPFRLFLVDDGSAVQTDYEALTRNIDVRIMRLPKNLGISGAMNAGLQEILAGDHAYIARLDVGDMCEPERFAKQIAWLNAHPEIGILGSAVKLRLFDVANTLTAERILKFPVTPESCVRRLSFNCPASHPAMMIRREVFEQLKGYSEDYPAAEDFDLMWRANNMGFKIANLEEVLLIKDETPGSISQKRRRRQIFSRMRIQWENRRLLSPHFWAGIGKSALTLAAPASAINAVKFISRSR